MKTSKQFIAMALIAILALAFTACDTNSEDTAKVQAATPKNLSFGSYKVTISSADKFTTAEWNTLCDKVVAAIKRGYDKDMGNALQNAQKKLNFDIFANTVTIVLLNSTTYDCEVKSGEYRKIYLKKSALGPVDLQPAVKVLADESGSYTTP